MNVDKDWTFGMGEKALGYRTALFNGLRDLGLCH